MEKKKRALALGGGGPAVGLSIGALNALKEAGITFDVWTCACIGAWLGVVYNQAEPGKQINTCEQFFGKFLGPTTNIRASRLPESSRQIFRQW